MRGLNRAVKSRTVPPLASLGDVFKPGDAILHSGIYRVLRDLAHQEPHDVTCLHGRRFPSLRLMQFPALHPDPRRRGDRRERALQGAELRDRRRRSGW